MEMPAAPLKDLQTFSYRGIQYYRSRVGRIVNGRERRKTWYHCGVCGVQLDREKRIHSHLRSKHLKKYELLKAYMAPNGQASSSSAAQSMMLVRNSVSSIEAQKIAMSPTFSPGSLRKDLTVQTNIAGSSTVYSPHSHSGLSSRTSQGAYLSPRLLPSPKNQISLNPAIVNGHSLPSSSSEEDISPTSAMTSRKPNLVSQADGREKENGIGKGDIKFQASPEVKQSLGKTLINEPCVGNAQLLSAQPGQKRQYETTDGQQLPRKRARTDITENKIDEVLSDEMPVTPSSKSTHKKPCPSEMKVKVAAQLAPVPIGHQTTTAIAIPSMLVMVPMGKSPQPQHRQMYSKTIASISPKANDGASATVASPSGSMKMTGRDIYSILTSRFRELEKRLRSNTQMGTKPYFNRIKHLTVRDVMEKTFEIECAYRKLNHSMATESTRISRLDVLEVGNRV